MSCFVVLPGALVPASIASRLLARAQLPAFARRLARGRAAPLQALSATGAAHRHWLWRAFGGTGEPVSAPYAWRALNQSSVTDVATETPLWHADPVHFAFARDHLLVTPLEGNAALSADESVALAEAASSLTAETGAILRVIGTTHWFLAFDPAWTLTTVAFDAAIGRSVQNVLPEGADAARWRKLLTEIQMHWHQHPVNETRDAAGRLTVNGLWLHGGGAWQELPRRPYDAVIGDDAIVRGWALAAGVTPSSLLAGTSETLPRAPANVLVYHPPLLAAARQNDWDAWLNHFARYDALVDALCERAFAGGHAGVTFVLGGDTHVREVTVARADRLAIWRNAALPALLAEPEPA